MSGANQGELVSWKLAQNRIPSFLIYESWYESRLGVTLVQEEEVVKSLTDFFLKITETFIAGVVETRSLLSNP